MKKLVLLLFITALISCKEENKYNFSRLENNLKTAVSVQEDSLINYSIKERMKHHKVSGISVAVTENGKILGVKSYGVKIVNTKDSINDDTKFQGASISKSVTGLAILKLANSHNLDLDEDINKYLTTWKVPENKFTKSEKVTIRNLLNHTSGMKGINFSGYNLSDTIPTTIKVLLTGKGNYPKAFLDTIPNSRFSYSGIGYVVLQQLIEDVSKKEFMNYMKDEVFIPLKMMHSTFVLNPTENFSFAHSKKGKEHPDNYKRFPASAPAGIWTTAKDLAKFSIAIENAYYGTTTSFITPEIAKKLLAKENGYGLGIGVRGKKDTKFFFHGGSNPGGFKGVYANFYKKRKGIVILTNSENGNLLHDEILRSFSTINNLGILPQAIIKPKKLDSEKAKAYLGKYQFKEMGDYFLDLSLNNKNYFILTDKNDGMIKTYIPTDNNEFIEKEEGSKISFERDSLTNKVVKLKFGSYIFYKVN